MKGVISIFVLPYEVDNFAITLHLLKRNSVYLDNSIFYKLDITFCTSNLMTDWNKSLLPAKYLVSKVKELCTVYLDWCEWSLFIEEGDLVLGCVSHRRKAWKENPNADFFIWLDPDILISDRSLLYASQAINKVKEWGFCSFLISPQIVRQWDKTWDILVNRRFVDRELGYQKNAQIYFDVLHLNDPVRLIKCPSFKFGGGFFSILSKDLIDIIGIPESFGHYGFEDTFIMHCSDILVKKGVIVNQFILQNLVVGELNRFKISKTLSENLCSIDRKKEFWEYAKSSFIKELTLFSAKCDIVYGSKL